MANGSSTLARIQGRGLVETTTRDVEMPATTPAGALEQGRGPDSAKMAGTPPAKVNALRVAVQDAGSRRLEAIRDVAKEEIAADKRVTGIRQKASVLGRLDETMATYINTQLQNEFLRTLLPQDAKVKDKVKTDDRAKVMQVVSKIIANKADNPVTTADINFLNGVLKDVGAANINLSLDVSPQINAQLIAQNLFDNLTKDQMSKTFGDAVTTANQNTTLDKFLVDPAADTLAMSEGLADSDQLEVLLKSILPKGSDLSQMRLGDVTAAIQQWKQEEFKDVTTYQQTLSDPMASKAQRDLAAENLRRLGKVGVLALDQKVGDLDAQMQDGDMVTIDDQSFKISEFFEKPESLAQLQAWLDKPDTAPKSLQAWITSNRDAIKNQIDGLSPQLKNLADKVEINRKSGEVHESIKNIPKATIEKFFPGWSTFELDTKIPTAEQDAAKAQLILETPENKAAVEKAVTDALAKNPNLSEAEKEQIRATARQQLLESNPEYAKSLKYKVLQDKTLARNAELLLNNLNSLPEGQEIFAKLTPSQLRSLAGSEVRINSFVKNIKDRQAANYFKGTGDAKYELNLALQSLGWDSTMIQNVVNLFNKNMWDYSGILGSGGRLEKLGLMKGTNINFAAFTDKIKELAKAEISDLMNDKSAEIKSTLTKWANEIDYVIRDVREKSLENQEELRKLFDREGPVGIQHPDKEISFVEKRINELEKEKNDLVNNNRQAIDLKNEVDRLGTKRFFACSVSSTMHSSSGAPRVDEVACNAAKANENSALERFRPFAQQYKNYQNNLRMANEAQGRFNQSLSNYRNNYQQYLKRWQDAFDKYIKDRATVINKENEARRTKQSELVRLWTGVS